MHQGSGGRGEEMQADLRCTQEAKWQNQMTGIVPTMGVNCFDKFLLSVDMSPMYNEDVMCYKIEPLRSGGIFTLH